MTKSQIVWYGAVMPSLLVHHLIACVLIRYRDLHDIHVSALCASLYVGVGIVVICARPARVTMLALSLVVGVVGSLGIAFTMIHPMIRRIRSPEVEDLIYDSLRLFIFYTPYLWWYLLGLRYISDRYLFHDKIGAMHICSRCGYALRGLQEIDGCVTCPECGHDNPAGSDCARTI
jgi:hypothetical protein